MIPFVGPSYQLKTARQGGQRSINLMPTAVEANGGKAGIFLAPAPGLVVFSGETNPPEPGYSTSTYYSTGDALGETYNVSATYHPGGDCSEPGFYAQPIAQYRTLTLSMPSVFNLGGFFPGMFEEYGITEGVFYGQVSGRSYTMPLNAGGAFGFGPYSTVDEREELWHVADGAACFSGVFVPGALTTLGNLYATDDEAFFAVLSDDIWADYPIHNEPLDLYWRITLNFTAEGDFINDELVFVTRAEYLANLP